MSSSLAAEQDGSSNASQKTMTTTVVLDSLPYIDPVNEDYEQYALALIESEMQQTAAAPSQSSSKQPIQTTARSQILQETVQRLQQQQQQSQQGDDKTTTSLLPNRTFPTAPSDDKNGVQSWQEAVRAAKIAYESERLRALQLEVAKEESAPLWNAYNSTVAQPRWEEAQAQLGAQRQIVEEINHARQTQQTEQYGRQLHVLSMQYEELIRKQRQLKEAVTELEAQVEGGRGDALPATTGQKRKSPAL